MLVGNTHWTYCAVTPNNRSIPTASSGGAVTVSSGIVAQLHNMPRPAGAPTLSAGGPFVLVLC